MRHFENHPFHHHFKSLHGIAMPRIAKIISRIIIVFFVLIALFLFLTPWVQTSSGSGRITTLKPEDRPQTINAPVSGRIGEWYVRDGIKVKKGDPLVKILDNDPQFFERLQYERDAIMNKLTASENAARTAEIDYRRQTELFEQGLASKKEKESALIKWENLKSKASAVVAELNKAEVKLSRQTTQLIKAPRDGTVLSINSGDSATFVRIGDILATFLPDSQNLAVELYMNGLDAPLIYPGREVRLIFEGWPAVQFSGWPSMAVGTFKGVVQVVDPALSANGKIRVLVTQADETEWPSGYFLRYGARARGWVLLDTVPVGYEVWRQLNGFPPEFSKNAEEATQLHWGAY